MPTPRNPLIGRERGLSLAHEMLLRQDVGMVTLVGPGGTGKSDFNVTNENAPVVAEICHRLDGLPLAIELAAARIKLLSSRELLSRLEHRFDILRGGARDLPERQQTLRSAIDGVMNCWATLQRSFLGGFPYSSAAGLWVLLKRSAIWMATSAPM